MCDPVDVASATLAVSHGLFSRVSRSALNILESDLTAVFVRPDAVGSANF